MVAVKTKSLLKETLGETSVVERAWDWVIGSTLSVKDYVQLIVTKSVLNEWISAMW